MNAWADVNKAMFQGKSLAEKGRKSTIQFEIYALDVMIRLLKNLENVMIWLLKNLENVVLPL